MIHPRTAYRWAIVAASTTGPAALFLLAAWGMRWDLFGARAQLLLMAYMLLLLVAVCAGSVAVVASVVMASHRAFTHGYRTAMFQMGYDVLDQQDPDGHRRAKVVPMRRNGTED